MHFFEHSVSNIVLPSGSSDSPRTAVSGTAGTSRILPGLFTEVGLVGLRTRRSGRHGAIGGDLRAVNPEVGAVPLG